MSRIVSTSRCPKGRLLYYFPRKKPPHAEGGGGSFGGDAERGLGSAASTATAAAGGGGTFAEDGGEGGGRGDGDGEDDGAFSDWCGWHNDHSSLTGAPSTEQRRGEERHSPTQTYIYL